MKNNEKIILVLKVNPDCKALKCDCDPFDEEDGMSCDKKRAVSPYYGGNPAVY